MLEYYVKQGSVFEGSVVWIATGKGSIYRLITLQKVDLSPIIVSISKKHSSYPGSSAFDYFI